MDVDGQARSRARRMDGRLRKSRPLIFIRVAAMTSSGLRRLHAPVLRLWGVFCALPRASARGARPPSSPQRRITAASRAKMIYRQHEPCNRIT
jgi:hypothetical protein